MASRTLLATACLLVLLLLTLGGAPVEARARRGPRWAPRRTPESSSVDGYATTATFDVGSFGAAGDGTTDDTAAFQKAWAQACSSAQPAVVLVPAGRSYLLGETSLSGPCKSRVTFRLDGTLVAPEDKSGWGKPGSLPRWIVFRGVDGLTVTGEGALDGRGESSWRNSCRTNPAMPCTVAPSALTFASCDRLAVDGITLLNAPQIHLWVERCRDATLSGLTIASPGDSPENDGIHVARSDGVRILGARIATGDDCLSVATGTANLYAAGIECGPGHGISIGSLGRGGSRAEVSNVTVDGASVSGTMFGARIKTWQGGSGFVRGVRFLNMAMDRVKYPILIDQSYCTRPHPNDTAACDRQQQSGRSSAVEVSDVVFGNIWGTTVARDAIRLHCSEAFPCRDVVLRDVQLRTRKGGDKNAATSSCENAVLAESSNVSPAPCSSAATKKNFVRRRVHH
ncbi:polygalacturonase ADPG2-like [Panicum virgatum]|uniref:Polygalacturonase n=1 Tax=Panicum virgatum TaxID=38727 RepID=A0A8T0V4Z6_PANVG|nr:polygalacturonase ADPG2-like [Panicum virgatum]KAG2629315.1 hypothetical protein PVAP13_3KG436600 [Panicum virgatum]